MSSSKLIRFKCVNCGNGCISVIKPLDCCCNNSNWKILKHQLPVYVGDNEFLHSKGEI